MSRQEIYKLIDSERDYQETKWGNDFDDKNNANDWSSYITQYNGNASFAKTPEEWKKQMTKVATLAIAALEAFERNGQLPKRHYDA